MKINMKNLFLSLGLLSLVSVEVKAQQEYKVITIVESIVSMGVGRSRIVENTGSINIAEITTERDGNKSTQGKVDRKDVKEAGENL
ncbi:MAG: hypothetical protein AAB157_04125, partial [Candidatus Omnitrophota bacterium]